MSGRTCCLFIDIVYLCVGCSIITNYNITSARVWQLPALRDNKLKYIYFKNPPTIYVFILMFLDSFLKQPLGRGTKNHTLSVGISITDTVQGQNNLLCYPNLNLAFYT